MKSVQFFPLILWYIMFGIKILIFFEENGLILGQSAICLLFFGRITSKNCSYVHDKLQRKPSV